MKNNSCKVVSAVQQSAPIKNLRTLVADHRKQQNLSVRQAAQAMGMSHTSLWRFEKGKSLQEKQWTALMRWLFSK